MGKKIDRFVITLAAAFLVYLLLLKRIRSHTASIVLAVLICGITGKILRKAKDRISKSAWIQKKHIRSKSSGTIMHFACGNAESVKNKLSGIICKVYNSDDPLEVVQYHPSAVLEQQKVFELWKKHREQDRLIICATCKCDQAAFSLASSLKHPRIALIDADAIRNMIAECPEELLTEEDSIKANWRARFKKLSVLILNRKNAPKSFLFAFSMLGIYLLNGKTSYLVSALALLFCAFASLHRAPRPAKLF